MNLKGLPFFRFILALLIITSSVLAYHFFYALDYEIIIPAECNPATESCFVVEECDDDGVCAPIYYSEVSVLAREVKSCNPHAFECAQKVCEERACAVTYCDPQAPREEAACDEL